MYHDYLLISQEWNHAHGLLNLLIRSSYPSDLRENESVQVWRENERKSIFLARLKCWIQWPERDFRSIAFEKSLIKPDDTSDHYHDRSRPQWNGVHPPSAMISSGAICMNDSFCKLRFLVFFISSCHGSLRGFVKCVHSTFPHKFLFPQGIRYNVILSCSF